MSLAGRVDERDPGATTRFRLDCTGSPGNAQKQARKLSIKVQRKGIYETMARDIGLMHKAVRLMPPVSIKGAVDLNMVLSELWTVTQEEMNFLTEAANISEFAKKNKGVAFVNMPILYREYTTTHVLGHGIY